MVEKVVIVSNNQHKVSQKLFALAEDDVMQSLLLTPPLVYGHHIPAVMIL